MVGIGSGNGAVSLPFIQPARKWVAENLNCALECDRHDWIRWSLCFSNSLLLSSYRSCITSEQRFLGAVCTLYFLPCQIIIAALDRTRGNRSACTIRSASTLTWVEPRPAEP